MRDEGLNVSDVWEMTNPQRNRLRMEGRAEANDREHQDGADKSKMSSGRRTIPKRAAPPCNSHLKQRS
jgi:hypothetical protein